MSSDFTRFRDRLEVLVDALFEPGIADNRGQIRIELDHEAGRRFEIWASHNSHHLLMRDPNWMVTHGYADSERPTRSIVIDGITISWPVARIARQDGTVTAHPPPTHCVEIPPRWPGQVVAARLRG